VGHVKCVYTAVLYTNVLVIIYSTYWCGASFYTIGYDSI